MAQENLTPTLKPAADEPGIAERTRGGVYFRPSVDILEMPEELLVLADVPGASGDDVEVNFEDGLLSIYAQVKPRQSSEPEYLLCEYGVGDFFRTFEISEAINAGKISAECADGVLALHLPKAEALKPRRIAVKSA